MKHVYKIGFFLALSLFAVTSFAETQAVEESIAQVAQATAETAEVAKEAIKSGSAAISETSETAKTTVEDLGETSSVMLKSALVDILEGVVKTASEAKEFLYDQVPDVVQQLLAWELVYHLLRFLTGVGLVAGIVIYWLWLRRGWGTTVAISSDAKGGFLLGGVVMTLVAGFSAPAFFNLKWLMVWVAPKLYLINYVAELVK